MEHRVVSSMAAITQPLDAESPMMEMFINVKLETIDDAGVSKHCGGGCEGHCHLLGRVIRSRVQARLGLYVLRRYYLSSVFLCLFAPACPPGTFIRCILFKNLKALVAIIV